MLIPQNDNLIPRNALMRMMNGLSEKRMIYICAPAGYGKTVAARQWLKYRSGDGTIVALDEYDNEVVNFCKRFCLALAACQPENELLREIAFHPLFETAPDEFAIQALNALDAKRKTCIVIDDIHFINNKDLLRLISILIKRLPNTFQVLVLSRHNPPESFLCLLLKENSTVISSEALKFSRDEIVLVFKGNRQNITQKQADDVLAYTDGWAIGVNALLLSGVKPPSHRLANNHLAIFLKTQVWEQWDELIREFMLKTAVVDELTPALCTALTDVPDSAAILEKLAGENAFLLPTEKASYRFHQLFRDFLRGMLYERGEELVMAQMKRAGEAYLKQGDFYKSVEYFIKCKDDDCIAKCFALLQGESRRKLSVEKLFVIVKALEGTPIIDKYPFLLGMQSWMALNDGRMDDMAKYIDEFFRRLPEIICQSPDQITNIMFIKCLDFRISMHELERTVREMPEKPFMQADSATVTQNMPVFHRSSRDFSEYAGDSLKADVRQLKETIGELFGDEQDLLENCLIAGILYEQGNLMEAYQYAISANTMIQQGFSPESKFCAMVILVCILDALSQQTEAENVIKRLQEMIDQELAYYLSYNFSAFLNRRYLDNGDVSAADSWLNEHGSDPHKSLSFYKLYGHFTTARAHIAKGDYESSIIILTKLITFCETYKRPLDVIEAHILLAIAYWKKKRGFQSIALNHLEQAVNMAYGYGYIQIFANEGAELTNMLGKLKSRSMQKKDKDGIPVNFVKQIFFQSMQHAKHRKGLTSGQPAASVKYTEKQKTVMRLMCEGHSYRQIAELMGIKFSTVRSHIELIYKKLDVLGENEAIIKIRDMRILDDE